MKKQISRSFYSFIGITLVLLLSGQSIEAQYRWGKAGSNPAMFMMGVDSAVLHEGQIVNTIKSINGNMNSNDFGTLMYNIVAEKYLGKRIKMTASMKSTDVDNWAGFWVRVDGVDSKSTLSFDNMQDRAIIGTTDWKQYEIVLDVPTEASNIAFGALLSGTGQIWFNKVNFTIVDNSVPTTGRDMY